MFKRKSGVDTIDFTKTKTGKKIAPPKEVAPSVGGFLDFTQQTGPTTESNTNSTQSTETPNAFGFLSDFSQSSSSNTEIQNATSYYQDSNNSSISSSADSAEVSSLKIKIEDLEFKIERLLERLSEMETKFKRM